MDQTDQTPEQEPADTISAAEQALKKESRIGNFLKSATRWLFGLLIVFGLGALAVIFLLYSPTRETLQQTQADLETARQKITDLESQVQKMAALETQNASLKKEVDSSVLHIKLLTVLADVDTARVALAEKDAPAAKTALTNTAATINQISTLAGSSQSEAVKFIQDRLKLVLSEIETDPATAQTDLGVLAGKLIELEQALFNK